MTRTLVIGAALAALFVAAQPAASQGRFYGYRNGPVVPPEGVIPGLFDAQGRPCVKQCPDDRLPCDPPSYKTADGRCSTQWR